LCLRAPLLLLPRRLRRQHKAAHGFSGYTGAVLDLLHFVARRRLTALKRTAAPAERVSLQDQDRATYCIAHPFGGYAAKTLPRPVLIPAPFRRSHTPQGKPAARDCQSKSESARIARMSRSRAWVNSPLRVEL